MLVHLRWPLFLAALLHSEALDSTKHRSTTQSRSRFCILGMCINTESNIEKQQEETDAAKDNSVELERKNAELEAWHAQERARVEQERLDKIAKEKDEANFCTCGPWMCGLNDNSVCWRKCCNNEFGGPPPTMPPTAPPGMTPFMGARDGSTRPAVVTVSIPFVGDKSFDTDPASWHPWGDLPGTNIDAKWAWDEAKKKGLLPSVFGGHNIIDDVGGELKKAGAVLTKP
eukprot:gnl/MRDRNA2_/MRDRNA2_130393_c0_seq1.p1 gnl/MRDRNA2_/MRDRNA2_130393_c0~~gnl/MRDRNA2_/MRDRNA2_130393_c0_seq1.p1  ORF type:complete len:229 (+),score=46.10 gnl/MRDRNA2_/MRDRNA2_130393_c0_seq1:120-806(+)